MKQETLKALADGSSILTVGTGATSSAWAVAESWNWVNTNAAGIGVLATVIFGFIAIGFNIYNSSKAIKADENEKRLNEHIEHTTVEFASVHKGIGAILAKLDNKGK